MKFRTEIKLPSFPFQINYETPVFGLGSCFTDHIKQKLSYFQFQTHINDFGVIFNPVSIKKILKRIVNRQLFEQNELFLDHEQWKHFDLHSSLNHADANQMLENINRKLHINYQFLQKKPVYIFTLGTAWVYKHKKTGDIVSNCHKLPASHFDKILLSPIQIVDELNKIIQLANKIAPSSHIIFSLSPVRHLKDGFVENNRSKAHLLTALHQVIDYQNIVYFPAYEIVLDDLRDYRFYTQDMVHPNHWAIDYVWQQFQKSLIDPAIHSDMLQIDKIRKALQHKAFDKQSAAYQKHLQQTRQKILHIRQKYPWMQFEKNLNNNI